MWCRRQRDPIIESACGAGGSPAPQSSRKRMSARVPNICKILQPPKERGSMLNMELVTHTLTCRWSTVHEAGVLCCTCRKTSKLNQQGRRGDHHTTLISHLSSPHRTAASQAERLLRGIGALDRTKCGSSARFIAEPLSMQW